MNSKTIAISSWCHRWKKTRRRAVLSIILIMLGGLSAASSNDIPVATVHISSALYIGCTLQGVEIGVSCSVRLPVEIYDHTITPSVDVGVLYTTNYLNLSKQGIETRISGQIIIDHDPFLVSVGTNYWNGFQGMSEFVQQTGLISFQLYNLGSNQDQSFMISYENDGAPFHLLHLADFMDRYRTAAVRLQWKNDSEELGISSQFTCFTGLRDKSQEEPDNMVPLVDEYGNHYPYGYVCELGYPYRYSCIELTVMKKEYHFTTLVHNDVFRHMFQDLFAHAFLDPTHQGGFKSMDNSTMISFGMSFITSITQMSHDMITTPYSLF